MKRLIQILFGLFLLIFPFSIRWVVYEPASYRFGNFNPWVTGFVYLPEVLLLIIFLLWLGRLAGNPPTSLLPPRRTGREAKSVIQPFFIKGSKLGWLWGLCFAFAINAYLVTLIQGDAWLGAAFVLRLFEVLVIVWLLADQVLKIRTIVRILLFGALLQIIWGYLQWKTNGSLGLTFLGESVIGPDVLGVAKVDLAEGTKQIRAYGTFLHPNILATYLLVVFFVSLKYLKYGYKLLWLAIFTWGIYLTESRAAILVGLAALGLYFIFKAFKSAVFRRAVALIVIGLLVIGNLWFFQKSDIVQTRDLAWQERLNQNIISREMLIDHRLGVGVRNFTLEMEAYSYGGGDCGFDGRSNSRSDCGSKLLPWEFQPVHNTYFLILNEVGIQGLLLLIAFLLLLFDHAWKAGKAIPLFALLFVAPFDHFLWDSWVGMMLVALVAGFFVVENHEEGVVEHLVDVIAHKPSEN